MEESEWEKQKIEKHKKSGSEEPEQKENSRKSSKGKDKEDGDSNADGPNLPPRQHMLVKGRRNLGQAQFEDLSWTKLLPQQ